MLKPLKCKECGSLIDYNHSYDCYECDCGMTYNSFGQVLRPREEWQDEYDNDDY